MKHNPHLFLAAVLIGVFAAGCKSPTNFGPVSVPAAYDVEEPVQNENISELKRLLELQTVPDIPYRISPMDQYAISVYEQPELGMNKVIVTPDGLVSLPLIGVVKLGGLTLQEATDRLTRAYSVYVRHPKIALIPLELNGHTFTIMGRVNEAGCYPISHGKTRLADAVAMARGLAQGVMQGNSMDLADLHGAFISRNGEILPVDFAKALYNGDKLHNIPLMNGDYIFIPSSVSRTVVVLGEVRVPSYIAYKQGLTLAHALPYTNGLLETHSTYVKIIRGGLKNPTVYTVDVDKILAGKIKDFELQASDIVFVSRDALSDWNVIVRKILPTLQSLSMLAGPFGNPSGYIEASD